MFLQQFSSGQKLYSEIENTNLTSKDSEYKELITKALNCFQTCSELIHKNSLFSKNEELNDYATSSIKYISVPYYLGEIYQKIPSIDPFERFGSIKQAKRYLEKFIETCIKLEILNKQDIEAYRNESTSNSETKRNEKVRRYKRDKQIQQQIKMLMDEKLKNNIDEENEKDNEFERKISLLLIENNVIKAIDTIISLKQEIEIVDHMSKLWSQNDGKLPQRPAPEPRPPLQPIVIRDTKQYIKDNAFRPGWNLPTVSLEEAADIDYQQMKQREARQREQEKRKLQKLIKEYGDSDDDEELMKNRDFDSFKDDHPRGSGNTGNKGYFY